MAIFPSSVVDYNLCNSHSRSTYAWVTMSPQTLVGTTSPLATKYSKTEGCARIWAGQCITSVQVWSRRPNYCRPMRRLKGNMWTASILAVRTRPASSTVSGFETFQMFCVCRPILFQLLPSLRHHESQAPLCIFHHSQSNVQWGFLRRDYFGFPVWG